MAQTLWYMRKNTLLLIEEKETNNEPISRIKTFY